MIGSPVIGCDGCNTTGGRMGCPEHGPGRALDRRPFACSVCNGHGTVNRPPWIAGDQLEWAASDSGPYECRACGGTGIVWK